MQASNQTQPVAPFDVLQSIELPAILTCADGHYIANRALEALCGSPEAAADIASVLIGEAGPREGLLQPTGNLPVLRHRRLMALINDFAIHLITPARLSYAPETWSAQGRLLLNELEQAIATGDGLAMHMQPKIDSTGAVTGAEALIRWNHSEKGAISPALFIPYAESSRLVGPLLKWVLGASLASCASWWPRYAVPVAVNLSANNLQDPHLPGLLIRELERHGLPVQALQIELTEHALMSLEGESLQCLETIAALGIEISLDDFGAGYSSLSRLAALPVSAIKLDRSLINAVTTSNRTAQVVASMAALASKLSLDVVAEGVESTALLAQIFDLGCCQAQGYVISRPLAPDHFLQWLDTSRGSMRPSL